MSHSSRHKPRHHRRHVPRPRRGPWANGPIPVVGLVGGIGSGKSAAAAVLGELGLQVLDADAVGHALLNQRPARDEAIARFGREILDPTDPIPADAEPRIDRGRLARIVFADPAALRALEEILHPAMRNTFERAIARAGRNDLPGVVLDAAILFEAGWNDLCDAVVHIDASREVRLARLGEARAMTPDDLDARERAQAPLDSKRGRADAVIANQGDREEFSAAVAAWWRSSPLARRPPGHPSRRRVAP